MLETICGGGLLIIVVVIMFVIVVILPLGLIGMTLLTLIGSIWGAIVGGNR